MRVEMRNARFIRYGAGARALCEQIGREIADSANGMLGPTTDPGFIMDSKAGRRKPYGRWRVTVVAKGRQARNHNARHNTLYRATFGQ